MPRQFSTTSGTPRLDTVIGLFGAFVFGPGTIALVCKVSDANSTVGLLRIGGGGLDSGRCSIIVDTMSFKARSGNSISTPGITVTSAEGWLLLAITKASGSTQVRFHKYVFSTNTWSHSSAGSNLNNSAVMSAGVCFSENQNSHIDVAGVWNRVLTDNEIEQLSISMTQWINSNPYGLWRLDQESRFQLVSDVTGNGANETSKVLTTPSDFSSPLMGKAVPIVCIEVSTASQNYKTKVGGSFTTKPSKIKVSGAFVTKPLKIKIGGVFV